MNNFSNCLSKTRLRYQTVIDHRLTGLHQLFSWASLGHSKCLINKMTGLQGHLTVSGVAGLPCVLAENTFTSIFLLMYKFSN